MAIKKSNPTSAGQRFRAVASYDEVTKTTPEKSLLETKEKQTLMFISHSSLTTLQINNR